MNTPICDFVREYTQRKGMRLHMPGHKGVSILGMEHMDITEIAGADSLYEAEGIIAESEAIASALFGCRTFYSTEGSSQCIRAMLYLIQQYAKKSGKKMVIAAGRNAHKTFLTAVAMLDLDVQWLYPEENASYLSCNLKAEELNLFLEKAEEKPVAVYITCPDYLGNHINIDAFAKVCHKHGVLLAVDNAHGAYLRFFPESQHPIDLGADLCCDSAHKTFPVLTGGAYLHLSEKMDAAVGKMAKNAMMLFGSTSPSYLILQSLDAANRYLEMYPKKLETCILKICELKEKLQQQGYSLYGNEPLKLTICAKPYGYTGTELADYLRRHNMEPEFADRDYLVLMLTPEISEDDLDKVGEILCRLPQKERMEETAPKFTQGRKKLSVREAMFALSETLPIEASIGRVLAVPTVGCPPAVPILVCGEEITEEAIACFAYYGITTCCVVAEETEGENAGVW